MHSKNNEIMGFLNYYASMTVAPQYAVMLKGRWGVGKTWFVENLVDQLTADGKKVLYVSLYGMTQVQQIEDEFFRQLHPVLSSKSVAFAGRLIKGVVKGALKIDLDRDGTDDGTMTVGAPDLGLPEYLRNTNGLVLVFDDLERCSMPVADVLGYINYFVEHDGRKVVVVCNEEVLIGSDTSSISTEKSYVKIKEKLIGKTFSIEPDFDAAIKKFLMDVNLDSTRELLQGQRDNIERMYVCADYKNLRHLRQAILDFSRLVEVLDPNVSKKSDLLGHLLRFFLLYSFEIKSGAMSPADIPLIEGSLQKMAAQRGDKDDDNLYSRLSSKYGSVNIIDALLPVNIWESLFDSGLFNADEINAVLKNSKYFLSQELPVWVKLWNAHNLSDDAVDTAIVEAEHRLRVDQMESVGELKHIVSSLINLSKLGIYNAEVEDIVSLGLVHIHKMASDGMFSKNHLAPDIYERAESGFGGYGYHEKGKQEFKDFVSKVNEVVKTAIEDCYPDRAEELLRIMSSETDKFASLLVHDNYQKSDYYGLPILSFIDPLSFVTALRSLLPKQLMQVHYMVQERYSSQHYRDRLKAEAPWLRSVASALSELVVERAGRYSGVHFADLRDAMLKAAQDIDGE